MAAKKSLIAAKPTAKYGIWTKAAWEAMNKRESAAKSKAPKKIDPKTVSPAKEKTFNKFFTDYATNMGVSIATVASRRKVLKDYISEVEDYGENNSETRALSAAKAELQDASRSRERVAALKSGGVRKPTKTAGRGKGKGAKSKAASDLIEKLSQDPNVKDPEALGAWIGRRMGGLGNKGG